LRDQDIVGFPSTPAKTIPEQTIGPGGIDTNMVKGSYSISTFGYADNFDATYNFILPFYIDQNVTAINQVILNLLFQKYRGFAKASASESAHTHVVNIGAGGSHFHDITGKATEGDDSAHQHTLKIKGTTSTNATLAALGYVYVMVQPGSGGSAADCDDGSDIGLGWGANPDGDKPSDNDITLKTNCTISAHTHPINGIATDVKSHSHPGEATEAGSAHTHALTFGIYEDAAYPDNVEIEIDGADRTVALGGPWDPDAGSPRVVNLDLTKYIEDIGAHSIELSTDTTGRCIPMLWIKTQSKK